MDIGSSALGGSSAAVLWAHLSRAGNAGRTKEVEPFVPPSAPQDKTATTMRVLLHDTQMNLENFSKNVERLIKDTRSTTLTVKQTATTFEQEHDKLMGSILDLVNRAQSKILASIGAPAQSDAVGRLCQDVDRRFDSLDQRLDAIQAFNQTHSQALQTQMQAIQGLQSQQGVVIAAVAPLLPLLQSSSSGRDSAAAPLPAIPKPPTGPKPSPKPDTTPLGTVISVSSDDSAKSARKRRRSTSESRPTTSSPLASGYSRKRSRGGSSSSAVASSSSAIERKIMQVQTPRRPLRELFFHSPHLVFTPREAQHVQIPPTIARSGTTATAASKSSPSSKESKLDRMVRKISLKRTTTPKPDIDRQHTTLPLTTPSRKNMPTPQIPKPTPRAALGAVPSGPSLRRTPLTKGPLSHPAAMPNISFPARGPRHRDRALSMTPAPLPRPHDPPAPTSSMDRMPAPSFIPNRNQDTVPVKEGKRFIPLVDTDEEDEDD